MKLFLQSFLFSILIVCMATTMQGQRTLMMEKRGSMKVKRFYEGDEITYRAKGDKEWKTSTIVQLIPEDNIIVLDKLYIRLEDIEAFKRDRKRNRAIAYSNQLYIFGTAWTAYTAIDDLVISDRETDWEAAAYVGGTSFVLGSLLRLWPKTKTLKFGKKRRLRILDLTPVAAPVPKV